MAPGEEGTGGRCGQNNPAEALVAPCPLKGYDGLPEGVNRSMIVALRVVVGAEALVRQCLQDDLSPGRGERQGALGGGDRLVICTHEVEMACQKERDLGQSTRVVEGLGQGLGFA